jgi:predicted ester cyclase
MSEDDLLAVILRGIDAINRGDADAHLAIFAPNAVFRAADNPEGITREQYSAGLAAMIAGSSDRQWSLEDAVASGNRVAFRFTVRATNKETGKRVNFTGMSFLTIVDGKIVEQFTLVDHLGRMQQLGLISTPGQAS